MNNFIVRTELLNVNLWTNMKPIDEHPKRVLECLLSQKLLHPFLFFRAHPGQREMTEYNQSFMYPHKKQSHGVMSWDLGGKKCSAKSWAPVRLIQRSGNVLFRNWWTSVKKCDRALSCYKNIQSSVSNHLWK